MSENRSKPDQFLLRLPPGLRDRIRARAESEGRSTNEEIVRVLEESLSGPPFDLENPAVQKAMIARMQEMMANVVEDMREEQRLASGIPLLVDWFDQHPEERAEYDALSDDEQDAYAREKAQELWIEHLNRKRQSGRRKAK